MNEKPQMKTIRIEGLEGKFEFLQNEHHDPKEVHFRNWVNRRLVGVARAVAGPRGVRLRHLYFNEGKNRILAKRIANAFIELHGLKNVETLIKPTFLRKIPKDRHFKRLSLDRIKNDIRNFKDRDYEIIVELNSKLKKLK
ncbi:MAG: hypothetical protein AABY04_02535 [Candidatus Micrarchaeota archaeon]